MGELVKLEVADGIGTILLNRPPVNALNDQLTGELAEVAGQAATSGEVRAVAESLLVGRRTWSRQLLQAVDEGKVEPKSIPLATLRKLLLHRKEIDQLVGAVERKGYTLVPTAMYWKGNKVKVEIGLARGKKLWDKRQDVAKRDAERDMERAIKR